MKKNGGEFVDGFKRFEANTKVKTNQMARRTAGKLFNKVLQRTPVDTGYLRAGWTISYGPKPTPTLPPEGATKGLSQEAVLSALESWSPAEGIVWLSNAVAYARVLEYGLYPNPVKQGTYLRKGQMKGEFTGPGFFALSEGGFSKQLPEGGMVRLSLMEMGK